MIRGLSNDKRSLGISTSANVKTDNPLTYAWIGQETSDLRQPIEKEQSQNPSLPFAKGSSGTQYSYTQPLPTDVTTLISQGSPGPSITPTVHASSIGSLIQPMPGFVPMNNWAFNGMGMMPQNGDHFKSFFANQNGLANMQPTPLPASVLSAVQEQQNVGSHGSNDVWASGWQTFQAMGKDYKPSNQFREGTRYS